MNTRVPIAAISLVFMCACRVVDNKAAPAQPPMPLLRPVVSAPTAASSSVDDRARRIASATDEELARTVVSVFGDTAALHPLAGPTPDAEPVWDIDVRSYETHERVTHYVQLFSTSARENFREQLSRGTRYEPMIRAKLRAGGMPEDLTYLALIESGYNPHAYSRAAAVGMWQFMSSTARDVGMRVDWWMDERRDPARSTDGAIRFLRELQAQFGSLYLAAAAYNGGPGRVARGLTRYADAMEGAEGEDRFFALAGQGYLKSETKNYVPQLIAAALIAKLPSRYGMLVDSLPPFVYDSVQVREATSLAAIATASGATASVMRELNPAILRGVTPPDASVWVHVPVGSAEQASAALETMPDSSRAGLRSFTVPSGSLTIAALAARNGISASQLAAYNPSLRTVKRGQLASGQLVRIPTPDALSLAMVVPDPSIERYGGGSSTTLASRGVHVVRRGETLGGIANKYGLSLTRLKALNGIKSNRAVPGQTLRVRGESKSKASPKKSASKTKTPATKKSAGASKKRVSSKAPAKKKRR